MPLADQVRAAIAAMPWLQPSDAAAAALAEEYAACIDQVRAASDPGEITRSLYLGPHLLRVLDLLGGTPHGRPAETTTPEANTPKATLSVLRAEQGAHRKGA